MDVYAVIQRDIREIRQTRERSSNLTETIEGEDR